MNPLIASNLPLLEQDPSGTSLFALPAVALLLAVGVGVAFMLTQAWERTGRNAEVESALDDGASSQGTSFAGSHFKGDDPHPSTASFGGFDFSVGDSD